MIKSVMLSRLTDGLVLCESNESFSNAAIMEVKLKVRHFHKEVTAYSKAENIPMKIIEHQAYGIFYKVSAHIVFTIIVQKSYPVKLAHAFLEAIITSFFEEARCVLGATNLQTRLESIESSHYFVKFDRTIKKKKSEFQDPSSLKNVQRIKRELESIQDMMKQNMVLLDGRQGDLEKTADNAKRVAEESKKFHAGTNKLVWHYWIKKNMIWLVLLLLVVGFYVCFF